ncbi:uncharacterized protein [Rutidosis leptorrhynchoides]|uniref:uncharacterized protein n=1 Tax=Rutidosis leptorrhynchoides TaxID=125765 RepID=UPI003A9A3449
MIQSFHESLTGPALNWYVMKNVNLLDTWNEVADTFLKQYKFNMDIAPSREDLERMEKKMSESFKEYAVRWRNLAAQITHEPTNKELMKLFVKTLPSEFCNRMASTYVESFNQLIPVGEQIEMGIREGWFTDSSNKRFTAKKEKEMVVDVNVAYSQENVKRALAIQMNPRQPQTTGRQSFAQANNRRQFSPLPGSPSQVLTILRKKGLLTNEPKRPNRESLRGYDPAKKCDYHNGELGHSNDECFTLKHKIQNLLDTKAFSFQIARPNVQKNPLPEHEGMVNAILEPEVRQIKNSKVNVADAYNGLVRASYYPNQEDVPLSLMKERIAKMVDDGIIVYADRNCVVSTISHIIIYWEEEQAALDNGKEEVDPSLTDMPPLEDATDEEVVIEIPQPYEYVNNKAVPWSYDLDVDLVTRSGRTYAQNNAQPAKPVTDEEVKEFLAMIKASEYNIVDQLRKMPAQISLLELIQTSSVHQKSLMKVLSEIRVPETVEADKVEDFVGSVLLKDMIAFSDEEFPLEGRGHNKALYISIKHKVSHVSRVLIDNGSALNICQLATLHRLKVDPSKIHAAKTSVRAFDGTKKEVIGEIHLDVQIGLVVFNIHFQVLDIPTAFNFLLGRPWIHTVGAVPSSLHQTVKFVIERKPVTVYEPDYELESSYHSFELVSTIHASRGSSPPTSEVSDAALMVGRVMVGNGFVPGNGLGRNGQGIRNPIEAPQRSRSAGLGYHGRGGGSSGRQRQGRHNSPPEQGRRKQNLPPQNIHETFPSPPIMMQDEAEVMDTLGQPSGKFDYMVKYSAPPSFYFDARNIVPSGWDGMDDPTPSKTENSNDTLEGVSSLFDDLSIGAIDGEPLEETGPRPQEDDHITCKGMEMVQSNATSADNDHGESIKDSIEVQQSWEQHENAKTLTSE